MYHSDFEAANIIGQFSRCENVGLEKLGKLVTHTGLISEEQARMFTYQYVQVLHFMRQQLRVTEIGRPLTALKKFLDQGVRQKALARIYQLLINQEEIKDLSHRAWCKDIGCELSADQWRSINLWRYKVSNNIAIREHHYKILHRWYWTPDKLSKIFPNCIFSLLAMYGVQSYVLPCMVGLPWYTKLLAIYGR